MPLVIIEGMTMIELENHPWLIPILDDIDDPSLPVNENNPLWDYVDSAVATMGTISHNQIDMDKVQQNALLLFKETKDIRVIVHLLRTLQHGKKPQDISLAIFLFSAYIQKYWLIAAPQPKLKARLFKQIIQRFLQANKVFEAEATGIEKKLAFNYAQAIKQFFDENEQIYDADLDQLIMEYERFSSQSAQQAEVDNSSSAVNNEGAGQSSTDGKTEASNKSQQTSSSSPIQNIEVNHENEAAWRRTLIKVAEILFERNPGDPIGVRLRRHAIFNTLSVPVNNNDVTDLMSVPVDRVNEYKTNITKMTVAQWTQIENELTLMPFWLEGHYISANVASHLGFANVAEAILEELQSLLHRLPKLYDLKYSDKTPFISADMKKWVTPKNQSSQNSMAGFETLVFDCYEEKGLQAAVEMIEASGHSQEMRDNYYYQTINAQLLKHAGFKTVAKQQALSMLVACENMTLSEWEPSFIDTLTQLTKIND